MAAREGLLQGPQRYLQEAKASLAAGRLEFVPPDASVLDGMPTDAQGFYDLFGHFLNSYTGERVPRLAPFQADCWGDVLERRYSCYPKSQKIGMTATFLMQDCFLAITRDRGREIFLVCQNEDKAVYQLGRLKKMLRESPTFSRWLVERPPRDMLGHIMRDVNSTLDKAVIWNPDAPTRPSVIWAVGINDVGPLVSNANVGHIHMSDISTAKATDMKISESFAAARSRLVNTRGTMVVESPPSGNRGMMAKIIYSVIDDLGLDGEPEPDGRRYMTERWLLRRLGYRLGIEHGLFTQEVIDAERSGPDGLTPGEFARFYEASMATDDESAFDRDDVRRESREATNVAGAFLR